jgi:hypothetical protein
MSLQKDVQDRLEPPRTDEPSCGKQRGPLAQSTWPVRRANTGLEFIKRSTFLFARAGSVRYMNPMLSSGSPAALSIHDRLFV